LASRLDGPSFTALAGTPEPCEAPPADAWPLDAPALVEEALALVVEADELPAVAVAVAGPR